MPSGLVRSCVFKEGASSQEQAIYFSVSSIIERLHAYAALTPTVVDASALWLDLKAFLNLAQPGNNCQVQCKQLAMSSANFLSRLEGFISRGGVHYITEIVHMHGAQKALEKISAEFTGTTPKPLAIALQTLRQAAGWSSNTFDASQISVEPASLQQNLTTFTKLVGLDEKLLQSVLPEQLGYAKTFTDAYLKALEKWIGELETLLTAANCSLDTIRPRAGWNAFTLTIQSSIVLDSQVW